MYDGKKILGLIPARGGSKQLPRKNLKPLLDKPLIAWTIEEAKKSKYLDRTIISTEDREIAEIAKHFLADVPFSRPKELAGDAVVTIDVALHAIEWLKVNDSVYDIFVLLQPTSPLRTHEDIDNAVELLFKKKADAILSVCETDYPPTWMSTLPDDYSMNDFYKKDHKEKRRQDIPTYYRTNGAVYVVKTETLLEKKTFALKDNTFAYVMPPEQSVDIDKEIDFLLAEVLLKQRK